MKRSPLVILFLLAGLVVVAKAQNPSNVIYSGLRHIAIPTNDNGVYLNIDTGAIGNLPGWDFNPTFGGARVYNSPNFQPARTGSGIENAVLALTAGSLVDGSLTFSSGYGASGTHLGNGLGQFQPGTEGYIGFQFITDANSGPHFGWMRVIFTAGNSGGFIEDWGYETGVSGATPASIEAGNITQAAPVGGVSAMTLAGNKDAILGSTITDVGGGVITAVTKNGSNTWTLNSNHPFTGATTANGGTLKLANTSGVTLSGTSNVVVHNGGTLLMGANNQINQATKPPISLGTTGGAGTPARLDAGGFSQGTVGNPLTPNSGSVGLGALTLLSNSVIDLTGTSVLHFANSSTQNWTGTLSIWNWSGTAIAGGGAEQILFGGDMTGLSATQLTQVSFYSDNGTTLLSNMALILADGEVIPDITAVPEPATFIAAVGAMLLIARWEYQRFARRRRRKSGA